MLYLLLFMCTAIEDTLSFKTVKIFQQSEILSNPVSVACGNGNFVVLDTQEKCLFVYNEDGFVKRVGREGEGPGEFLFKYRSGKIAFDHKNGLFVVADSKSHRMHYFDDDLNFVKTEHIKSGLSIFSLYCLSDGNFLVMGRKNGYYSTEIWDDNMFKISELHKMRDEKWVKKNDKYTYHPWAGDPFVFGDATFPYIFLGNRIEDYISVYDGKGKLVSDFLVPFGKKEVTEDDKNALILDNPWLVKYKTVWPDKRYSWDVIKPLSEKLIFIGTYENSTGTYSGLVSEVSDIVSGNFTPKYKFRHVFGFSAGFFYSGRRIFSIESDEDDNYVFKIQELSK